MEPDWTLISQILGPAAPMIVAIIWLARWYRPIYDRQIRAAEHDIILRRQRLKICRAHLQFLKEQGYEIEIPDLINSFSREGKDSG
jgi:hypothetical protein